MKKKILVQSLLLISLFVVPLTAFSHARLVVPQPRNDDTGDVTGPCGGIPAANPVVTYTAGQSVSVQFEDVIQHAGPFTLSFSAANDANFVLLGTYPERQGTVLIPDVYNETITIPNTPCAQCTLQLAQANSGITYYSCADIAIVATGTPTPIPSMSPMPTPTGTGPNSAQGISSSPPNNNGGAQMASCGSVHDSSGGPGQGPGAALMILLPLAMILLLRQRAAARIKVRSRYRY
jgi:hypothetical protein